MLITPVGFFVWTISTKKNPKMSKWVHICISILFFFSITHMCKSLRTQACNFYQPSINQMPVIVIFTIKSNSVRHPNK